MWLQETIELRARPRGVHLITPEVLGPLRSLANMRRGLLNLFLQHTSASLAINENADPDVRRDLESYFNNRLCPEHEPYLTHTTEGSDDMPAHIKSILVGSSLNIPIVNGRPGFGTWQGIYLCEHRNHGGSRRVVATAWGETS
ncbi:MAG: YjbQ family protein [Spirochaetales bacterium]|nr:secondary thiamine-phosphate synthase enzyme YjbQ [Leptospiraceae bacterium]MCP5479814.1 YjbQ family protein [Spirochaetales bacterium]MCP5486204.1 YjbQ family protein [Spirochaetales bacterium]